MAVAMPQTRINYKDYAKLQYTKYDKNKTEVFRDRIYYDLTLMQRKLEDDGIAMTKSNVLYVMNLFYEKKRIYHFYKIDQPMTTWLQEDITVRVDWDRTECKRFPIIDLTRI